MAGDAATSLGFVLPGESDVGTLAEWPAILDHANLAPDLCNGIADAIGDQALDD